MSLYRHRMHLQAGNTATVDQRDSDLSSVLVRGEVEKMDTASLGFSASTPPATQRQLPRPSDAPILSRASVCAERLTNFPNFPCLESTQKLQERPRPPPIRIPSGFSARRIARLSVPPSPNTPDFPCVLFALRAEVSPSQSPVAPSSGCIYSFPGPDPYPKRRRLHLRLCELVGAIARTLATALGTPFVRLVARTRPFFAANTHEKQT